MEIGSMQFHFIGIGGAGMSGIARIIAARGGKVSGSDLHDSSALDGLRHLGITVSIGHTPEHVEGLLPGRDVVVRSSAIPKDNKELQRALERGLEIVERAELLARLMDGYRSIAVAGTHGKTTTTSMLTVALQHCGMDPSFAIGGTVRNAGTNAHHGSGNLFVVEADESDGSFTTYKPDIAIITNIELDHVDNYSDLSKIDQLFQEFVRTIKKGGALIACSDDPGVVRLLEWLATSSRSDIRTITYGQDGDPTLRLDRIHCAPRNSTSRAIYKGRVLGEISLSIPGRHNLFNAAAALAVSLEVGASAEQILAGLAIFTGARRRFEVKGTVSGVTVVDDYGHHPTEILATLEAARTFSPQGQIVTIFQPHRYSRTQVFAREFADALSKADHTFLLEIYSASEKPIAGVTSHLIASRMDPSKVTYEPSMPEVIARVTSMVKPGDLILTMGAGDVSSLAPLIIANLESE